MLKKTFKYVHSLLTISIILGIFVLYGDTLIPGNRVYESSLQAQKKRTTVKTKARANQTQPRFRTDIEVKSLSISDSSVNDDDRLQVSFYAKNRGESRIAKFSYIIYLGKLRRRTRYVEYELGSGFFRNIGPGDGKNLSRGYTIPWNIDPSRITDVVVFLDPRNELKEKDEDRENNYQTKSITVHIHKLPDLTITKLQKRSSGWPSPSSMIDVDFTIRNIGTRKSDICKYKIIMRAYRDCMSSRGARKYWHYCSYGERKFDVYQLSLNETMTGSVRFRMLSEEYSITKKLKFHMTVDWREQIRELNESNNALRSQEYIRPIGE